jgi:uncharacterized membrane protein YfcA
MDLYEAARIYNTVAGTLVVVLCARSLARSYRHLNPSERLVLLAILGYAISAGIGSLVAYRLHAPANYGSILMAGAQTWAVVALFTSKRRAPRA